MTHRQRCNKRGFVFYDLTNKIFSPLLFIICSMWILIAVSIEYEYNVFFVATDSCKVVIESVELSPQEM